MVKLGNENRIMESKRVTFIRRMVKRRKKRAWDMRRGAQARRERKF